MNNSMFCKLSPLALGATFGLALSAGSASAQPPELVEWSGDFEVCDPGVLDISLIDGLLYLHIGEQWLHVNGDIIVGHKHTSETTLQFETRHDAVAYLEDSTWQSSLLGIGRTGTNVLFVGALDDTTYGFLGLGDDYDPEDPDLIDRLPTLPDIVLEPMEECPFPEPIL